MNEQTKQRIREHLSTVMERLIQKRTVDEPFSEADIERNNPFGYYLVPIEVWKGAKFERSFVTSLGQGILEQLGKIIAEGTGATAINQYDTVMTINTWRIEKIEEILKSQRGKGKNQKRPNWDEEVKEILVLENQRFEEITVKSDLYIRRQNGREEYYSFKTVKPNLDQTETAKRDMLSLKAGNPDCEPYFALPFNPAGEGNIYRRAHTLPYKLFNMDEDPSVLIGADMWNKIGDCESTYDELIQIFKEVGEVYSYRIRTEYLEIRG
ncbi:MULTISPECIES: TdeIII family type II restriction endonuclease [Bacillus]|uniref:TdeIII family type II restriction endonuclease n=1 Tax=Bacillus TaxID=1386 RepID=UPI001E612B68|nr:MULTISPECIES: TdeIII family type II restriction endonuclease [Bacillus]MDA1742476.1 TdeIII family type II restriction endonuclease [Bacillus cereus]MCC2390487.1 TdeIII family type II restriction endonuclease [Bacillus pacificus]MCC2390512.1 TdeIII family type II restriction endonuclease [Bacillus pacificus]MDA1849749.1 TdeIII family type II restriction endonuclease [Bacillus cereus]MDF0736469.1 TdeIII family type II restriction endonuclease [Bacillus pacificus]